MRLGAELYDEPADSLPGQTDYTLPLEDGAPPIPEDVMLPLSEDGIRVYTDGGSVTVENCTVKIMRSDIRMYLASSAIMRNSTAIDCGATNFNMPKDGTVIDFSGNFSYAPLSDFRLAKSNQNLEITIIPSLHATGPHNLADVQGNGHNTVFHPTPGPVDDILRPIVVYGDNITIINETESPIILEPGTGGNTIFSAGDVTDNA